LLIIITQTQRSSQPYRAYEVMGNLIRRSNSPDPQVPDPSFLHSRNVTVDWLRSELEKNPKRLNEIGIARITDEPNKFRHLYFRGATPLAAACVFKNWNVAQYLIEAGADANIADEVILCWCGHDVIT
jgi:hypothetical protein